MIFYGIIKRTVAGLVLLKPAVDEPADGLQLEAVEQHEGHGHYVPVPQTADLDTDSPSS